jgi:hypothetical protein
VAVLPWREELKESEMAELTKKQKAFVEALFGQARVGGGGVSAVRQRAAEIAGYASAYEVAAEGGEELRRALTARAELELSMGAADAAIYMTETMGADPIANPDAFFAVKERTALADKILTHAKKKDEITAAAPPAILVIPSKVRIDDDGETLQ